MSGIALPPVAAAAAPRSSARRYLVAAIAAAGVTALYLALPRGGLAQVWLVLGALVASVGYLTAVVLRLPGPERRTWRWLVLGEVVYVIATAAWNLLPVGLAVTLPYPSVVDLAYFVSYSLFVVFLAQLAWGSQSLLLKARSGAALDGLVLALGAGLLAQRYLVEPVVRGGSLSAATVASITYPVLLAMVFGLAVQVVARRAVPASVGLPLGAWIGGELVADVWYARSALDGSFHYGHAMFGGWLVSYVALATVAGHLRAGELERERALRAPMTPRRELTLLSGAVAVILGLVVYQELRDHGWSTTVASELWLGATLGAILLRVRQLLRDVAFERRLREQVETMAVELEHAASHDPLTGLCNRRAFEEVLARSLMRRRVGADRVGVLILDLDSFKAVNDTHGHHVGDLLLCEVARRLREVVRAADLVARLGGDEFGVVLDGADVRATLELAERVAEAIRGRMELGPHVVHCSVSVGVQVAEVEDTVADVITSADTALYAAKRAGGGFQLYDPLRHRAFVERYQIEHDLRAAPERGGLVLHYQPVVDLVSRRTVAVEALLRWDHPERGRLSPLEFIPIAEESGAIVEVGRWVLAQACRDCRWWQQHVPGAAHISVGVNLSRRQLTNGSVLDDVLDALSAADLPPSSLTIEITETALMSDSQAMVGLLDDVLDALGVQLAMDDFGTGYSSLSELRTIPIDVLKIDKAFVDGIAREEEEWALAAAIVRLASSLEKRTLAEGVERASQLAHLRTLGCELGQGYLFARPMPLAELEDFLRQPDRLHLPAPGR